MYCRVRFSVNFVIYNLNVPIREKSQNGTFFFSKIEAPLQDLQSSLLPQGGSLQTYLPEENYNNGEPELHLAQTHLFYCNSRNWS